MKKMLQSQLKDLPKEEQERMIDIIVKNPKLFEKIGAEIQEKMKSGISQTDATLLVMKKYQSELQKILS